MRFVTKTLCAAILLLVVLASCTTVAASGHGFSCDTWPTYPEVSPREVSRESLLILIRESTLPEFMRASQLAADRSERLLMEGGREGVDIEQVFYEAQLDSLSAVCLEDEDGSSLIPAATLIARVSAALIYSAGLRNAPDEFVNDVLPSAKQNLTAKANILFLAASCSERAHPGLQEWLNGIGLSCAE